MAVRWQGQNAGLERLVRYVDRTPPAAREEIVPCRPDQSYVSWVIRNGGQPCGRPLVVNNRHPTFPEAEVASIESWIRTGAQ